MNRTKTKKTSFLPHVAVLLAVATLPTPARACCPAFPPSRPVQIAGQEVLIAWDAATKTEHFVRRASFESSASRDFGFLVPTPTRPTLAEAPDSVFDRLATAIQPRVVDATSYELEPSALVLLPFTSMRGRAVGRAEVDRGGRSVRVLEERQVAGYDAAVLEADDVAALVAWLGEHGYDARPDLREWLEPYVTAKWKVTAFKYASKGPETADLATARPGTADLAAARPGAKRGVDTKAVRMSFTTDRPLFPYRVPRDQIAKPGVPRSLLRVYFAGSERVEGRLGSSGDNTPGTWAGQVKFSDRVEGLATTLAAAAPGSAATWLTTFDDPTWPGGTDDLFFERARDASPVIPEPIVRWSTVRLPVPIDLLVLVGGVVVVAFRRRARRG